MDALRTAIETYAGFVTDHTVLASAVAAGLVVVLVGLLWWHRRRQREQAPVTTAKRADLIRRPLYLDPVVLSDVLAHLEDHDHGQSLRKLLDPDVFTGDDAESTPLTERTGFVRAANKAVAAATNRPDLVSDLDEHPDATIESGRLVLVSGRLRVLPASDAARLIEHAVPLLRAAPRTPQRSEERGDGPVLTLERTSSPTESPTLVLELEAGRPAGRFVVALDRDSVSRELTTGPATILGVVDRPLRRRERLDAEDYLRPRLSTEARIALDDRGLGAVVESLAAATGQKLTTRDLELHGPGATLTPAVIWH